MTFPAPVPEIAVANVDTAAAYYVNTLGFTFDWGDDQGGIAGISRGNCRLLISNRSFRKSYGNVGLILFWLNLDSKAEGDALFAQWKAAHSARRFFQKALAAPGHSRPRVINVDGNPSYPTVIDELKQKRVLGRRCRCRIVPYLNNVVEQDHRSIKRRVNASLGFRSFGGAQRTIQDYEAMHMIRKGQVRWLSKDDIAAQVGSSKSSSASLLSC
jgi:DDE superfamily endonuclease